MTDRKALEIIKKDVSMYESLEMKLSTVSTKALKRVCQMAERHTPMKPNKKVVMSFNAGVCPKCNKAVADIDKFCSICGTQFDWSEE